jgi:phospholipid transport system substrate-binding protein
MLASLPWCAAVAESAPEAPDPHALMTQLSQSLFAELDRERAALRRNAQRAVPLVDRLLSPHFDADYTARLVLGERWHGADPEKRQRFALALYHSLLKTYAEAVAEWTPDRLRILPPHGDPAALQATVRTIVARPGGPDVIVDYRLHRTADGWKVFDVAVDGVSYVRTYHDDVAAEVASKGLDSVIARLESQPIAARASSSR